MTLSPEPFADGATYEIQVADHLDAGWSSWFEEMEISPGSDEEGRPVTRLYGFLADQAALHRILTKLRDLGLQIQSVSRLPWPGKGS